MTGKKAQRVEDYIEQIISAIERIETYVQGVDREAFNKNTLVQDAVIRNFEIIGEAAIKIQVADPGFIQRHARLRLDLAYKMRNALIHGYDTVNTRTIWNTIVSDLPALKQQMTKIRQA